MAFTFRFDTLLRVREIKEDMAQQEFSTAQRHYNNLIEMKKKAINLKKQIQDELISRMMTGIPASEVIGYDNYVFYIEYNIKQLEDNITKAKKQLDNKREELVKAQKERKAIKRLKEIDHEAYEVEERRKDMRFIDEIAVLRHGRVR